MSINMGILDRYKKRYQLCSKLSGQVSRLLSAISKKNCKDALLLKLYNNISPKPQDKEGILPVARERAWLVWPNKLFGGRECAQWRILRRWLSGPAVSVIWKSNYLLRVVFPLQWICYNFIACVVIVPAMLYNSYNWSDNYFCSHSTSFHRRAVRKKMLTIFF